MHIMTFYALQAIQTKYLEPTNHRPARIKAWCQARKIIVSWDHGVNVDTNHHKAAESLAKRMEWPLAGTGFGALPDGGYAMTFPIPCDRLSHSNPHFHPTP